MRSGNRHMGALRERGRQAFERIAALLQMPPSPRYQFGASSVEYAILLAFIAAILVATIELLGGETVAMFDSVVSQWP